MTFKNLDDIDREKREQERLKLKENITNDIDDVFKDVFGKFKNENAKRKKERSIFIKILKLLGILALGLLVLNFIIGNIWLLKFFISGFF